MIDPLGIRPDLDDVEPYVSPQLPARYRMNTNESPYPPPARVMEGLTERLTDSSLNRYPSRDAPALVDAIAEKTGWAREGVWVANGSNEVLLHLFLAFGGPERTSLTFEPTYPLHTLIARIAGNRTRTLPRGPSFLAEPDDVTGVDIALFCSPNNPTGNLESRSSIEHALAAVPLVVVDEAYIEFAGRGASVQGWLKDHPNLIVVRTFSKAWSLAGVRLGYALAAPDIVDRMTRIRLPYSISTFAQLAGVAALQHHEEEEKRIAEIVSERERISAGLQGLGISVYPSDANFVLFDTGPRDEPDPRRTQQMWDALMERGVLVRNYAGNERLSGCLRVTAGLPEETDAFLDAMKEVLG